MDNETLRVVRERRSIRKYKKEQIKDEELDAILEAGTWAASGKNLQTAVMVVVQDQETIQLMSRIATSITLVQDIPMRNGFCSFQSIKSSASSQRGSPSLSSIYCLASIAN